MKKIQAQDVGVLFLLSFLVNIAKKFLLLQSFNIKAVLTQDSNNENRIYEPNLKDGWGNHLRLDLRKTKIKSIIDKNNLVVPNEIIRNEHYFYKAGQIIWIIFSEDKDIALIKYDKEKLSEYISDVKKIHQNFENKFRFKNYDKIKF